MKYCYKCKQTKSLDLFGRTKGKPSKLCKDCKKLESKLYRLNNKEKLKEYYLKNAERFKEKSRLWYQSNKASAKYKMATYNKTWRDKNKDKNCLKAAAYRCRKQIAIPKWVDSEEMFLIKEAYSLSQMRAKLFGNKWHVDHIVPLNGKNVCGLHTIGNLQVIPMTINIQKSNKLLESVG